MKQTDFAITLKKYLSDFLPGQRNVSPNTIKSYRDAFKLLFAFVESEKKIKPERLTFKVLDSTLIKQFLSWLENCHRASISTRNQRLAAIHSFYRFAQSEYPEILSDS